MLLLLMLMERNRMLAAMLVWVVFPGVRLETAAGLSYQMLYSKVTLDQSVLRNLSSILGSFLSEGIRIQDLQKTMECRSIGATRECFCEPGHRWTEDVCSSNQEQCSFPRNQDPPPSCVSNNTVTVSGSLTIKGAEFQGCLENPESKEYQSCHSRISQQMAEVYSTLRGFHSLNITKYSMGSVIVYFQMTIVQDLSPENLTHKSEELTRVLSATATLHTTGVAYLILPKNPVHYRAEHTVTCGITEDLDLVPDWDLKKHQQVHMITNGTKSQIHSLRRESRLHLNDITEIWAGEYLCSYHVQTNSCLVVHSARGVMDVCLLPDIDIVALPEWLRCQSDGELMTVDVRCTIAKSVEVYSMSWSGSEVTLLSPQPPPSLHGDRVEYRAQVVVGCSTPPARPRLTCNFLNRCNQSSSASVTIGLILAGESFCAADGDWAATKAGHTAVLSCSDTEGKRRRKCNSSVPVQWLQEESDCVHREVNSVLKKADVVDVGVGDVDANAAEVFSGLNGITDDRASINTFPNMRASVRVLQLLSQKLQQLHNQTTVNDLLDSSSNLMYEDLEDAWLEICEENNHTLAGNYLSSFQKLLDMASITGPNKKPNVEVTVCYQEDGGNCTNKAFNATVNLRSSGTGEVKTAGIRQLWKYLPNKDQRYQPNSIVVSTTMEKTFSSVEIEIHFPLLSPRPRNVEMQCVAWDVAGSRWSNRGCKWMGSSQEGRCVCTHLSSFAILMARDPIQVPMLSEITTVCLSVSVLSLLVSLTVELTVWGLLVKTNTLYLRHTAHINISLCLLVGNCCFLASSDPQDMSQTWCRISVVLKHFCYLSTFFWTLSLSSTLLHQAVFLFHEVSKKTYLKFSMVLGYVCPLLIVSITFLSNDAGAEGAYFSRDTCWLVYHGLFQGSIFTFLLPVGIIVLVNVISMVVVMMKLLDNPIKMQSFSDERRLALKTIMRTVVLLTPIFGLTWLLGLGVTVLDLTSGTVALVVNYFFVLLNSLQGFFILLTTCLSDKRVREAFWNRLKFHPSTASSSRSSSSSSSSSSSISISNKTAADASAKMKN